MSIKALHVYTDFQQKNISIDLKIIFKLNHKWYPSTSCSVDVSSFLLSQSITFNSYVDITITGERMQILTFNRHSQSLSSGGKFFVISLPHTLCKGTSVDMVISEDSWNSHLLSSGLLWNFHHLYKQFRNVVADSTSNLWHARQTLYPSALSLIDLTNWVI